MAEDVIEQYERELWVDMQKLRGLLAIGAKVEPGELTLADALPGERQMRLRAGA
jgi:hypothetical protein